MCCVTLMLRDIDSDIDSLPWFIVSLKKSLFIVLTVLDSDFCQFGIVYEKWRRTLKMRELRKQRRF